MNFIRNHLSVKLFFSYLVVILVGMFVIGVTANLSTPRAFSRHLLFMEQKIGGMGMMRSGPGSGIQAGMMGDFYNNFRASFNESLLIAVISASIAALIVSLLLSRSVIAPVHAMMIASSRIADGHYDERVETTGMDELGQLAGRFNQMAEQLEEVESMRRRLIGDVTHELRTPLTAIKGSMEGLIDGVLPANTDTFQQIHQETDRLSRLVDDLQELSRVESRAYSLDIRPLDVTGLMQTVVKRLAPQFDKKKVRLTLQGTEGNSINQLPGPIHVLADEDRIVQVLTNLVGNALQYTSAGGTVILSAISLDDEIRISVSDTGLGISVDHLAHIFDRFYRVDKSRSRIHGGSGIGLTIAKHLVEAQGGRIWVKSDGEGKGSVFTFTLPAAK